MPALTPRLLAFALLLPLPVLAADAPPTDGQWRGTAGAALSASGGNTRSQSLQIETELARETAADRLSLGGTVRYARGEVDGTETTTAQQAQAFGQYDWNLGPHWFAFGRLALEQDDIVALDLRSGLNGGLGWKWRDTPALKLRLSGGLGWTDERYASAQTIDDRTGTHFRRTSLLLALDAEQRLGDTLSVTQRLAWEPAVSGDHSTRTRYRADANVAINQSLSLTVGLRVDHLSEPPVGRRATDSSLFTGLNWRIGS